MKNATVKPIDIVSVKAHETVITYTVTTPITPGTVTHEATLRTADESGEVLTFQYRALYNGAEEYRYQMDGLEMFRDLAEKLERLMAFEKAQAVPGIHVTRSVTTLALPEGSCYKVVGKEVM